MAKVQIKGLAELEKKLGQLPEIVERAARAAVEGEVDEAVEDLRASAPVDEGELRDSTQGEISKNGLDGTAALTAGHATYVVAGTSEMPARDFVTPVIIDVRQRFPDRFADELREQLRRM